MAAPGCLCCPAWPWRRRAAPGRAAAPGAAEAPAAAACPRFCWRRLESEPEERRGLCEALAAQGFAALALPEDLAAAVAAVQALAGEFFDRPAAERHALGRLRLFRDKVVGYRELGGGAARFLEVHAMPGGRAVPVAREPRALAPAAARLHVALQGAARKVLTWLAEYAEIPPAALLQCLDDASLENLDPGDCSASVLRLCCYGCEVEEPAEGSAAAGAEEAEVFFDEHTDASYLTLAPVASQPGLQMRDASGAVWLEVERGLRGSGEDLVVFVGDFLEVLTKGRFTAARHRVAGAPGARGGAAPARRLSMPFLVRGQPGSVIDTAAFAEAEGEGSLLRLEGMKYAALRRFLDLKGRRRFQGERLLPATRAEEAEAEA